MSEGSQKSVATWAALRLRLVDGYDRLVRRLAAHLGSTDLAREAIHETYLRLQKQGAIEPVNNPDGYLFRAAANIAHNRKAIDNRYLTPREADTLLSLADDAPGPAQVIEAQSEFTHLEKALAQLPPRRRKIFEASWVDGVSHQNLARQHNVDVRTIQREIERATEHVRQYWKKYGLK